MSNPINCYFTLGGINYKNGFVTRYLNPALMMQKFKYYVLADIESARTVIDKEKARRMSSDVTKFRSWVKDDAFTDIYTAYLALDNIKQYVSNHKTEEKEFEALEVYIRKTDVLWKQNFNDYFNNYKIVDGKICRN